MIKLKGKAYRNTQEQVCENANDIEKIKEELENLGPTDQEIIDLKRRVSELENQMEIVNEYLSNLTISTDMIQEGAITSSKISSGAVTTIKLADSAVATNKIANGAITSLKLANDSVTTDKIQASAITTAKLENGSVNQTKLYKGIYEHAITIASQSSDNIENSSNFIKFRIFSDNPEVMTEGDVRAWLYYLGHNDIEHGLPATGRIESDTFEFYNEGTSSSDYFESIVCGVRATDEDSGDIMAIYMYMNENGTYMINETSFATVICRDVVRRLI